MRAEEPQGAQFDAPDAVRMRGILRDRVAMPLHFTASSFPV
jgi:hypothetical protein